jgi:hypothetical protein
MRVSCQFYLLHAAAVLGLRPWLMLARDSTVAVLLPHSSLVRLLLLPRFLRHLLSSFSPLFAGRPSAGIAASGNRGCFVWPAVRFVVVSPVLLFPVSSSPAKNVCLNLSSD